MKNQILFIIISFLLGIKIISAQQTGTLYDKRDGKTYKTVKIGNQWWMAENLACKSSTGCWAYDNDKNKIAKFGRLYNWKATKNVCPNEWHLPTLKDWKVLIHFIDGNAKSAKDTCSWSNNLNLDSIIPTGFNAKSGGFYLCRFRDINRETIFWTATINTFSRTYTKELQKIYCIKLRINSNQVYTTELPQKSGAYVRCIKN